MSRGDRDYQEALFAAIRSVRAGLNLQVIGQAIATAVVSRNSTWNRGPRSPDQKDVPAHPYDVAGVVEDRPSYTAIMKAANFPPPDEACRPTASTLYQTLAESLATFMDERERELYPRDLHLPNDRIIGRLKHQQIGVAGARCILGLWFAVARAPRRTETSRKSSALSAAED
ncbi:MAG: hypothetical protein ACOVS5_11215, partial [Oligoflexus sp.]